MPKIKEGKINPLSYTAVPIKLKYTAGSTEESKDATAFLYKYELNYYLITNWHNVSGINPLTGTINGSAPTVIEIPLLSEKSDTGIQWSRHNIPLYADSQPVWLIHPGFHMNKVDVVAILLGEKSDSMPLKAINEVEFNAKKPVVADDVFVLGFPLGLRSDGNFPYWKKGSIASEPDIDNRGHPKLLIDTSTRQGMSGSPVIYRQNSFDGISELTMRSKLGTVYGFLGVYSGRLVSEEEGSSELGIVWKKTVIDEIIMGSQTEEKVYAIKVG